MRSTCLASIGTSANVPSSSPALAKRTSAATNPTIRVAPGDSDVSCRPNARSRGLHPDWQASQWYQARSSRNGGPSTLRKVFARRPT